MSVHDRIALAIAKNRKIVLLTGDNRLRVAANEKYVKVIGTIGILDKLYAFNYIKEEEYDECLNLLKKFNGSSIRLPKEDIEKRLTDAGKLFVKTHSTLNTYKFLAAFFIKKQQ